MPRGADAPQRTENRERRTERPCGATDKVVVRERRSRRLICPIRPICPIAAFWQEMLECATAKALCRAASSVALWHVADVPGVQGELLPAGVWGGAPRHSLPFLFHSSVLYLASIKEPCALRLASAAKAMRWLSNEASKMAGKVAGSPSVSRRTSSSIRP